MRFLQGALGAVRTHAWVTHRSGLPCMNRKARRIRPSACATTAAGDRVGYDPGMSGMDPALPSDPLHWDATLSPDVCVLADRLMPLFYADLKQLAQRERGRVSAGATLQTTALVNEAYLKLRGSKGWNTDEHFLRAAALAMRHALVSHAVAKLAEKRGDGAVHVPITSALDVAVDDDATLVALNDALGKLAKDSLRLAQVVEC